MVKYIGVNQFFFLLSLRTQLCYEDNENLNVLILKAVASLLISHEL